MVGSPNQSAGAKGADEDDAIDKLRGRPGHAEFVHEPVDVEKRGGQLVQDEIEAIVIYEWALEDYGVSFSCKERMKPAKLVL